VNSVKTLYVKVSKKFAFNASQQNSADGRYTPNMVQRRAMQWM